MQSSSYTVRRPVFFVLNAVIVVLVCIMVFIYRDARFTAQQNRELIIQNDSILSVNIVLADSIAQRSETYLSQ